MARYRYAVLDTYRFVAALGIVIYHFWAHFIPFDPGPHEALDRFQTFVDFFFVLSGFVLAHTYGERVRDAWSYLDFIRKRIARIYPLHAATMLLCVGLYAGVRLSGFPVHDPSIIDVSKLPANLFLIQAWGVEHEPGLNGPSWSISAEMFVYLLFPVFMMVVAHVRPWPSIGLAVLIATTIEIARHRLGLPPGSLATYDFGMLRAVPMFLAGIATHRIVVALPARPIPWVVPHGLFIGIVALMLAKAPYYAIDALYPALVGLIALAERGGRPTILASPMAVRLGDASFAIYMIHTFIQIACVALVRRLDWTNLPALVAVTIGGSIVIIACGVLSFRLFETPMRRLVAGNAKTSRTREFKADAATQATTHP